VQEFNKGVYDYIIAADEGGGEQDIEDSEDSDPEEQSDEEQRTFLWCFKVHLTQS
jgi:ATP-dependent RNA helicase DDX56/DBP9